MVDVYISVGYYTTFLHECARCQTNFLFSITKPIYQHILINAWLDYRMAEPNIYRG